MVPAGRGRGDSLFFCLCKQMENTRQCVKNEKILYERKKLGNPCTENSENSTKLGGKNERTSKNQNQAKSI